MIVTEIKSHKDLTEKIGNKDFAYVLIYKKGSDLSECALRNINAAIKENKDPSASSGQAFELFSVNVAEVRDVHSEYSITSAPSLLSFEKGKFKNTYKGCNDKVYYKSVFENLVFHAASGTEKPQKRVTVYSTPTCSWCTTIKNYLRTNGIRFKDVDVSKDQKAAEEMVRRSGQQGVPQTNINGQVVVGFDKEKINRLLGIEG